MKKFFSHLSWLMILNLLIKPTYLLIIDARIQDLLGPEAWGNYFPLLSLSILFNIVLDAGLANHMTRLVAGHPTEVHGAYWTGWRAKLFLLPLYLSLLLGMGWLLGYRGLSMEWLLWIGINQALLSGVLYLRAGLQGLGSHISDATVSIADRSLLLCTMGWLLWTQTDFRIEWLLAGTSAALAATFGCGWWFLRNASKSIAGAPLSQSNTDQRKWVVQLRAGGPYALLFLLMMTYHRIDAVMLERMAPNGATQAGWYAMSYRLFEAANMIGFLFATLLLPYFTRMLTAKEDIRPLASTASALLWIGGGSVAMVSAVFPDAVLGIFYDGYITEAAPALPWLMVSFAIFAQGYVFSTLLTARGNLRELNGLAGAGAVLNALLNALWLSQADASNAGIGCAIISAATQFLVVGGQTALAIRKHPGTIWWRIGRAAVVHSVLAAAICFAFWRWGNASSQMVCLCLFSCLFIGVLPGLGNYRTLRAMLSDKMNTFADS